MVVGGHKELEAVEHLKKLWADAQGDAEAKVFQHRKVGSELAECDADQEHLQGFHRQGSEMSECAAMSGGADSQSFQAALQKARARYDDEAGIYADTHYGGPRQCSGGE